MKIAVVLHETLRREHPELLRDDALVHALIHRLAQSEGDAEALTLVVEHIAASARVRAELHKQCLELVQRTPLPPMAVPR